METIFLVTFLSLIPPGNYLINVNVVNNGVQEDHLEAAKVFSVTEGIVRGRPIRSGGQAKVIIPHEWKKIIKTTQKKYTENHNKIGLDIKLSKIQSIRLICALL